MNKKILVLGGGTFSHLRTHFALATPAFGQTAKQLAELCRERFDKMDVELILTKMADSTSKIVTNDDVDALVDSIVQDNTVKVVFFNVALCDYRGSVQNQVSGKYAERLSTTDDPAPTVQLLVAPKIINKIRSKRKDIFLVGFKTTSDASAEEMYKAGLNLLKKASCNLVLVNDVFTRQNFIITPEEGVYQKGTRDELLKELVDMTFHRTHLSFTRSTVVDGKPVPWNDNRVPATLRAVVNYCIKLGAYKKFNGVTTGHFACKLGPGHFLTSIRKTNFNEMEKHGLVEVKTDGDDNVISYGAKPSVGGQSQRIVFGMFPDTDCIVHFHCPLKPESRLQGKIPVVSQREYECGSHECGQNTANGLQNMGGSFDGIYCVMLDNHGPNIVFHHSIHPEKIEDFIFENFDLNKSTSGFEKVYLGLEEKVDPLAVARDLVNIAHDSVRP